MAYVETKIIREPWDADRRLMELRLDKPKLLKARDIAVSSAANATPFHAQNASGTFAYHDGIWAIRNEFIDGVVWKLDRAGGIEAIQCEELKLRIAYCNVDVACNDFHYPRPRSKKGAGAERIGGGPGLFDHLPDFARTPRGPWSLYYLMVDEFGATELTRPIIEKNTFLAPVERIYLSKGDDEDKLSRPYEPQSPMEEFEPIIIRKK